MHAFVLFALAIFLRKWNGVFEWFSPSGYAGDDNAGTDRGCARRERDGQLAGVCEKVGEVVRSS